MTSETSIHHAQMDTDRSPLVSMHETYPTAINSEFSPSYANRQLYLAGTRVDEPAFQTRQSQEMNDSYMHYVGERQNNASQEDVYGLAFIPGYTRASGPNRAIMPPLDHSQIGGRGPWEYPNVEVQNPLYPKIEYDDSALAPPYQAYQDGAVYRWTVPRNSVYYGSAEEYLVMQNGGTDRTIYVNPVASKFVRKYGKFID